MAQPRGAPSAPPAALEETQTLRVGCPVFLSLRDHRLDKLLRSRLPQKHLVVFWLKHCAIEIRVVEVETPSEIGEGGCIRRRVIGVAENRRPCDTLAGHANEALLHQNLLSLFAHQILQERNRFLSMWRVFQDHHRQKRNLQIGTLSNAALDLRKVERTPRKILSGAVQ